MHMCGIHLSVQGQLIHIYYEGILQLCFYCRDLIYLKKDWSAVPSCLEHEGLSGVKKSGRDREYCIVSSIICRGDLGKRNPASQSSWPR